MKIALLIVALAATPLAAQDHATWYAKAVACLPAGQAPALRLDQVNVVVVPGDVIHVPRGNDVQHSVLRAAFTPGDRTIWVAARYADTEWVMVHEFLHAVIGVRGHGPAFRRCRLLENQQPREAR